MGIASYPKLTLFFIILSVVLPRNISQRTANLLTCNAHSARNTFVPRIQKKYFNRQNVVNIIRSQDSNLSRAIKGKTFIYIFSNNRGSCSGSSNAIQVCYSTHSLNVVEEFLSMFLLQDSWQVDKESITTIRAIPSNDNCRRIQRANSHVWACCQRIQENFIITEEHLGFGVTILDDRTRPYRFRGSDTTYIVQHYEWNSGNEDQFNITEGITGQLLLLRMFINISTTNKTEVTENVEVTENEEIITHESLKESSSTNSMAVMSPSFQVGALVGGIVGVLVVLILIVIVISLIGAIILHSKGKFNKGEKYTVDAVTVSGTTQEEAEYADIGPEVCHKVYTQVEGDGNYYAKSGTSFEPSPYEMPESVPMNTKGQDDEFYLAPSFNEDNLYTQLENITTLNLCRENIKSGESLGSGQFGEVYKGICINCDSELQVAVKTLKEGANDEDRVKFLQEAAIMGQFKHPNVVTMYGVVTDGEPILLVLELLIKGDLRHHLLRARSEDKRVNLDDHTLLSFCRQIASGMTYLSNKAFVHRDLAARNILVSDDEICKIADFGMSRDLMYESYYVSHGGMIPVKWTAPEALHYKKYSAASDVWSYGILMYEIWSVGHKPFKNLDNNKVIHVIDKGYRLPPPPGCPKHIYSLMMDCWHLDATKRPSFMELSRQLSLPDSKLLQWEECDKFLNPHVNKLGANPQYANELYMDIQRRYQKVPP